MLSDLDQVNNPNNVIILYPAGSSGEFLAGAIAQVFPGICTSQRSEYSSDTRYAYFDLFNRTLSSSPSVEYSEVVDGTNKYLSITNSDLAHIGLAHPAVVDFINKHLSKCKVIEVTTCRVESKKFRIVAANIKIPKHQKFTSKEKEFFYHRAMAYKCSSCTVEAKLSVEWFDLLISDTVGTLKQIQNFLQLDCDCGEFVDLIRDYLHRNQAILESCGIIPATLD